MIALAVAAFAGAPPRQSCPDASEWGFSVESFWVVPWSEDVARREELDDAEKHALGEARKKLIADRGTLTDLQRERLEAVITERTFEPVPLERGRLRACVLVLAPKDIEGIYRGRLELEGRLRGIAEQIARHAGPTKRVYVFPAKGGVSGNTFGSLGNNLTDQIRGALNTAGVKTPRTGPFDYGVEVFATPDADGLLLQVQFGPLDDPGAIPVPEGTFTVNPWAVQSYPDDDLERLRDRGPVFDLWGIDRHLRAVGDGGLQVYATADAELESLAHGDRLEIEVWADQAARIQLFAVNEAHRGWVLWPRTPNGQRVEAGERVVVPVIAHYPDVPRPEQILVVALPEPDPQRPATFTKTRDWSGWCQAEGMHRDLFPPGSALRLVQFEVTEPPLEPDDAASPTLRPKDCRTGRETEFLP